MPNRLRMRSLTLLALSSILLQFLALLPESFAERFTPQVIQEREIAFSTPGPKRSVTSLKRLRIGTINALNFRGAPKIEASLMRIHWNQKTGFFSKSLPQLLQLAHAVAGENLDVVVLQEIYDNQTLRLFSEMFLGNEYSVVSLPGNEPHNRIAFLVRNNLPFEYRLTSNADAMPFTTAAHRRDGKVLTRDIPALQMFLPGSGEVPWMVIIGTHFHSAKGDKKQQHAFKRYLESQTLAATILQLRNRYGSDPYIITAGDKNGNVYNDKEYRPLQEARLVIPGENRGLVSFVYHHNGEKHKMQLDYILVDKSLSPYVSKIWSHPYYDPNTGDAKPLALTRDQQRLNPSDHYPVIMELKCPPLTQRKRIPQKLRAMRHLRASGI